ncbi:unnamed protein product [Rotaria sp. Silwood1]|nr:unnamed protein product [Rotaria sp. Silwood1]CAF4994815.1 unnamed protein product [Rotaria sp. Silwood1]
MILKTLGNPNQYCGDTNTIIVLLRKNVLYLAHFYTPSRYYRQYPDFVYVGCVQFNNIKQLGMYQFNIVNRQDVHPRHCLQLCKKYEQQYALLKSNTCLCTNIPIEKVKNQLNLFNCDRKCYGNYFYKCGHTIDSSMYSVYLIRPACPFNFLMTDNPQQCVRVPDILKDSFSSAQSYCKSMDSVLAKINDILEIQDLLPDTILRHSNIYKYSLDPSIIHDGMYFWIDRTTNIINNNNRLSENFFKHCMKKSKSINRNCIVFRREKILVDNVIKFQRCFSESDQCSSRSAKPVCVNKNLESHSNVIPSMRNNDSSIIKINISTDYLCGNDTDYHLIGDYCYKVLLHETTWHKAKTECERDNATLFFPSINSRFDLIKQIILHRHSYTLSTGIVHVDYFYFNETSHTKQHKPIYESIESQNFNHRDYSDLCEDSFHAHPPLSDVSLNEIVKYIDELELTIPRCGYLDFTGKIQERRGCSKESCNQSAIVICQKLPMMTTHNILAKRLVVVINYICL